MKNNNNNVLQNFMQNQNNNADKTKKQNNFSAKKKREENEDYADLTDKEIEEKEELLEAKKNSAYRSSRYNQYHAQKRGIREAVLTYGVFVIAGILLIVGIIKALSKNM